MTLTNLFLRPICVALVAAFVSVASVYADEPRDIAKRVSPSVVLLVMEDANGQPLALGSGFIVKDGVLATNMHVIDGAAGGYAKLADDTNKHVIRGVVASDTARDLALLSIDGVKVSPLSVADSGQVAVGDPIYAIGNPRGLEGTFSAGIVSSIRKVGEDSLLQITAPISPGSSGGPVLNSKGEVVGVAVATFKDSQNLNFAIPSNYLARLLSDIKPPVPLSKAPDSKNGKKSILDEMGGKSTDAVIVSDFLWEYPGLNTGAFSCSVRNTMKQRIDKVRILVVFHNKDGAPIETREIGLYIGEIVPPLPPGLARRVKSQVDGSVQRLTSNGHDAPTTKLEYRILGFEVVNEGEDQQPKKEP